MAWFKWSIRQTGQIRRGERKPSRLTTFLRGWLLTAQMKWGDNTIATT